MSNSSRYWVFGCALLALFIWAPDAWLGFGFYDHHDLRHHHLPWRTWAAQEWLSGHVPLWAPIGTGFPLAADGQTGVFYPPVMLLFMLFSPSYAMNLTLLLHLSLALWGMYRFVQGLEVSPFASLLAAIGFAFGGLMSTHALYVGMFCCWAWLPWGLWSVWHRHYGRLVMTLCFMALAGHPQAAVLSWMLVGVIGCFRYYQEPQVLFRIGLLALVAVGVTSPQWVSALELSQFSLRDGGLSTASAAVGSMPFSELLSVVFPYFFGYERPADIGISYWHRGELYWGSGINFWEMTTYVGMPILVLTYWGRHGRLWLGIGCLSFLLMLGDGTPLWWLLHHVPPFSLLRFPVRFSIGFVVALCVLAALGLDRLQKSSLEVRRRLAYGLIIGAICLSVSFGLLGWVWSTVSDDIHGWLLERYVNRLPPPLPNLAPEVLASMPPPVIPDPVERADQIVSGMSKALSPWTHITGLLSLVGFGCLLMLKSYRVQSLGICLVLFAELYVLGADYQVREATPMWLKHSESQKVLAAHSYDDGDRIATVSRHQDPALDAELLSSNLGLMYGYNDVMVPSPLRLVRQESLLTLMGLGLGVDDESAHKALSEHPNLVDLMGVRYLLSTVSLSGYPQLGGTTVGVYENTDVLPVAWFVNCARYSNNLWSALPNLEPRYWALVETPEQSLDCSNQVLGEVEVLNTDSGEMTLNVQTSVDGLVVIREAWYPGWKAYVNGEEQTVNRVNWNFQSVRVPSGNALVELDYSPSWLKPVGWLVLFSMSVGFGLIRRWYR